ncbi:putative calmodulin-like protein 5-like [Capsicum annuum]|nr:putative calmodulin-like protein 5-like [Capsicum annuum]
MNMTHDFAKLMSCEFKISMTGELNYFLGLQIKQSASGTMIHQQKYVKELLKKFSMEETKEISTIATAIKLDLDETGSDVEQKLYGGMIGSLLYLTTNKPDIVFSVGLCAMFQANPKESHLKSVKRIFRYLKGTSDLRLSYPKGSNFNLVEYSDADYAGYLVNRKSTTDGSSRQEWSWTNQTQDIIPVEGLNLDNVVPGVYTVHCLPLRLVHGDGSPTSKPELNSVLSTELRLWDVSSNQHAPI